MTRDANLYGARTVKIPTPEFIIFYNGRDEMPERQLLKLSDMYTVRERHAKLELEAVMLNISGEYNRKLKDACRTLREYAVYTDKIRTYTEEMELADAVERAIQECITENILKDFLEKHRAEAKEMSIFEYDQEKHIRQEREAAWEEGRNAGIEEGKAQAVIQLLEELGPLPKDLTEKIRKEGNPEALDRWLRLAARADSLADFEKNM